MNAFTQKPDVRQFIKEVKHARTASENCSKRVQNPTQQQAYFLEIKDKTMSAATAIRGNWPAAEVAEIKHVEKPKPVAKPKVQPLPSNSGMKVVQVPYTYTPQATGISIYQDKIDALLKGRPGQTAIECSTNAGAKRLSHAVQRTINRLGKKDKLQVTTKQVDGVTLVWVIERAR